MSGLPLVGKSTWIEENTDMFSDHQIVSSDQYKLTHDFNYHQKIKHGTIPEDDLNPHTKKVADNQNIPKYQGRYTWSKT